MENRNTKFIIIALILILETVLCSDSAYSSNFSHLRVPIEVFKARSQKTTLDLFLKNCTRSKLGEDEAAIWIQNERKEDKEVLILQPNGTFSVIPAREIAQAAITSSSIHSDNYYDVYELNRELPAHPGYTHILVATPGMGGRITKDVEREKEGGKIIEIIKDGELLSFKDIYGGTIEETERFFESFGANGVVQIKGFGEINLLEEFKEAVRNNKIRLVKQKIPLFYLFIENKESHHIGFVDHIGRLGAKGTIYLSHCGLMNTISKEELFSLIAYTLIQRKFGGDAQEEAKRIQDEIAPTIHETFETNAEMDLNDIEAARKVQRILRQLATVEQKSIRFITDPEIVHCVYENILTPEGLEQFDPEEVKKIYRNFSLSVHPDRFFKRQGQKEWSRKYVSEAVSVIGFLHDKREEIPSVLDIRWYFVFQRALSLYVEHACELVEVHETKDVFNHWYKTEEREAEKDYKTLFDLLFRTTYSGPFYIPHYVVTVQDYHERFERHKPGSFREDEIDASELIQRLRREADSREKFITNEDVDNILSALEKFKDAEERKDTEDIVIFGEYKGSKYVLKLVVEVIDKMISSESLVADKYKRPLGFNIDAIINMIRLSETPIDLENTLILGFGIYAGGQAHIASYGKRLFAASVTAKDMKEFEENLDCFKNFEREIDSWSKEEGISVINFNTNIICPLVLPKFGAKGSESFAKTLECVRDYVMKLAEKGLILDPHMNLGLIVASFVSNNIDEFSEALTFLAKMQSEHRELVVYTKEGARIDLDEAFKEILESGLATVKDIQKKYKEDLTEVRFRWGEFLDKLKTLNMESLSPLETKVVEYLRSYLNEEMVVNGNSAPMLYNFTYEDLPFLIRLDPFYPMDKLLKALSRFSITDVTNFAEAIAHYEPIDRIYNFFIPREKVIPVFLSRIGEDAIEPGRCIEILEEMHSRVEDERLYSKLHRHELGRFEAREVTIKKEAFYAVRIARNKKEFRQICNAFRDLFEGFEDEGVFVENPFRGDMDLVPDLWDIYYELVFKISKSVSDVKRALDLLRIYNDKINLDLREDNWLYFGGLEALKTKIHNIEELNQIIEAYIDILDDIQGVTDRKDLVSALKRVKFPEDPLLKDVISTLANYLEKRKIIPEEEIEVDISSLSAVQRYQIRDVIGLVLGDLSKNAVIVIQEGDLEAVESYIKLLIKEHPDVKLELLKGIDEDKINIIKYRKHKAKIIYLATDKGILARLETEDEYSLENWPMEDEDQMYIEEHAAMIENLRAERIPIFSVGKEKSEAELIRDDKLMVGFKVRDLFRIKTLWFRSMSQLTKEIGDLKIYEQLRIEDFPETEDAKEALFQLIGKLSMEFEMQFARNPLADVWYLRRGKSYKEGPKSINHLYGYAAFGAGRIYIPRADVYVREALSGLPSGLERLLIDEGLDSGHAHPLDPCPSVSDILDIANKFKHHNREIKKKIITNGYIIEIAYKGSKRTQDWLEQCIKANQKARPFGPYLGSDGIMLIDILDKSGPLSYLETLESDFGFEFMFRRVGTDGKGTLKDEYWRGVIADLTERASKFLDSLDTRKKTEDVLGECI